MVIKGLRITVGNSALLCFLGIFNDVNLTIHLHQAKTSMIIYFLKCLNQFKKVNLHFKTFKLITWDIGVIELIRRNHGSQKHISLEN